MKPRSGGAIDLRELAAFLILEETCPVRRQSLLRHDCQDASASHNIDELLDRVTPRLALALTRSAAVVTAYAPHQQSVVDELKKAVSNKGRSAVVSTSFPSSRAPVRKRMVGYARAYGDKSLVATVSDVVVAQHLRRHGVSQRLLQGLCRKVQQQGDVYDVGVLMPAKLQLLFQSCDFDLDREGSTAMFLSPASRDLVPVCSHNPSTEDLLNRPALQQLLQKELDALP